MMHQWLLALVEVKPLRSPYTGSLKRGLRRYNDELEQRFYDNERPVPRSEDEDLKQEIIMRWLTAKHRAINAFRKRVQLVLDLFSPHDESKKKNALPELPGNTNALKNPSFMGGAGEKLPLTTTLCSRLYSTADTG